MKAQLITFYDPRYPTAESRLLFVLAHKFYGSFTAMGKDLGVSRQTFQYFRKNGITTKYAGYLSRKFGFVSWLLRYEDYALMTGSEGQSFKNLLAGTKCFNAEDEAYILGGTYTKNCKEFAGYSDGHIKELSYAT